MPGPVENLKCYMFNGHAELSWHKPSQPNGPISQYLIYYEDQGLDSAGIPSAVDASTLSLALPDTDKVNVILVYLLIEARAPESDQIITDTVVRKIGPI